MDAPNGPTNKRTNEGNNKRTKKQILVDEKLRLHDRLRPLRFVCFYITSISSTLKPLFCFTSGVAGVMYGSCFVYRTFCGSEVLTYFCKRFRKNEALKIW